MPVMGGMESTGLIRKYEAEENVPRTPIIALTAHAMIGDKERCLEAGVSGYPVVIVQLLIIQMDEYVTKPLRRGDLLASIAKVLMTKIPGTNIPLLGGSVAGLPAISPITGTPLVPGGSGGLSIPISASQISRGLSPSPSASIVNIPDEPKPDETSEKTT